LSGTRKPGPVRLMSLIVLSATSARAFERVPDVRGIEFGLGCSAHQFEAGGIPVFGPRPGGSLRGYKLGRVVYQHGVVACRRKAGAGLGIDVDAQEAAPATFDFPCRIFDDLAGAGAAQPGDL
jgi:hypothetical protein